MTAQSCSAGLEAHVCEQISLRPAALVQIATASGLRRLVLMAIDRRDSLLPSRASAAASQSPLACSLACRSSLAHSTRRVALCQLAR